MRIIRKFDENKNQLYLDGNEIRFSDTLEYYVILESHDEYESINIENIISKFIRNGFIVHSYESSMARIEEYEEKLISSKDNVILVTTHTSDKHNKLENMIKELMIENRVFLH